MYSDIDVTCMVTLPGPLEHLCPYTVADPTSDLYRSKQKLSPDKSQLP